MASFCLSLNKLFDLSSPFDLSLAAKFVPFLSLLCAASQLFRLRRYSHNSRDL